MLASHDQEGKPIQSHKLTIPSSRYPVGHRTMSEIAMDRDSIKWEEKERNNNGSNRARLASKNQLYSLRLKRIANITRIMMGEDGVLNAQ